MRAHFSGARDDAAERGALAFEGQTPRYLKLSQQSKATPCPGTGTNVSGYERFKSRANDVHKQSLILDSRLGVFQWGLVQVVGCLFQSKRIEHIT